MTAGKRVSPADVSAPERAAARPHAVVISARGRELRVFDGLPLPLGVAETRRGLNFAVFSRHATAVRLVLFAPAREEPVLELSLDPVFNCTGHVWHVEIGGLEPGVCYGWRAAREPREPNPLHRFEPETVLVDPYAPALSGGSRWGVAEALEGAPGIGQRPRRRSLAISADFDWDGTTPPCIPLSEKVIYELHVRGFTRHDSAGVAHAGTFLGLIEKIPYLKAVGVTTVELMPVCEFDELENRNRAPDGHPLYNYWGYSPINFFAPKASYATCGIDGAQVNEFRTMVREFHRAGLEVFVDMVYNHTAEGPLPPGVPAWSLRGLDNATYYILDPETGAYRDYTGCGNTLNCNHPVVRNLILDSLRHWVSEMHVDGFRFDLAAVLTRGRLGEVLASPPVLERIAYDPVIADATLIAEAWDAAGLYQVGRFPAWQRWAEWNGPYRDHIRHFVRGDPGFTPALAARLAGSPDLFAPSGRGPSHSINFVTCHDGFTLADLVSYDRKHNEANGEGNRDGTDDNISWNCGVEGPTDDPAILRLRAQQMRNFLTLLLCSRGTPMLQAGDEFGRTQRGNNNAYCQDNEISWIDWRLLEAHAALFRFTRTLLAFRAEHPVLRQPDFLAGVPKGVHQRPDVAWHGVRVNEPDFGPDSRSLAMHLAGEYAPHGDCDVYLAANAWSGDLAFALPLPPLGTRWVRVIDTAAPPPDDIAEPGGEHELLDPHHLLVRARSCVLLRTL
ncbi:MAG: glycogen debranching protein GlgX [Candidatus Binatia bacterium]